MKEKEKVKIIGEAQLQPHDEKTELAVLATLMRYNEKLREYSDMLTVEMFYQKENQAIYQCIVGVITDNKVSDIKALSDYAKTHEMLYPVDELSFLDIVKFVSFDTLQQDIQRLRRMWKQRKLWVELQLASQKALDPMEDFNEVVNDTMNSLGEIQSDIADSGIYSFSESVNELKEIVNDNAKGKRKSLETGFRLFDEHFLLRPTTLTVIAAFTGVGKALPMNARILTPNGWMENKDIRIGQEVCSIDGRKSFVTGVYKRGVRPMYDVTFSDGRKVKCCGEHLWEVQYPGWASNHVLNTTDLKKLQDGNSYHNRMSVPAFSGEYGSRKEFVISPYLLGVLLGDGCLTRGVVWSKPDEFISKKIEKMLPAGYYLHIHNDSHIISTKRGSANPMLIELERLGLKDTTSKTKFIPKEYFWCNREQRVELLNGLMDTDGYVDKCGRCIYYTTSERLAKDVQELAFSLGCRASMSHKRATLYGRDCGIVYSIVIRSCNDRELVSLPRKKERTKHRKTSINIRSIEYVGEEECQCISVSHDSELYITDGYIVTHNTSLAMNITMNTARLGNPVAYYSLEMGKSELAARVLSGKAGISSSVIVNCKLEEYQLKQFDKAVGETEDLPIYIDERATVSFDNTITSIRSLVRTKGIKLAVIDYLQIYSQVGNSVEASLAYMARSAKNIAKECGVAVILLSQLSRGSSHPSINQLRGSGQIEESADNIVLIDRPEAFPDNSTKYEGDFHDESTHGTAKLILAKGRGVGTGNALVGFDGRFTQFYELDNKPQVEDNTPF